MSGLPTWVYELIDGLADYDYLHPKLYAQYAGSDAYQPAECPCHLLHDLVPKEELAWAAAYMRGRKEAEEKQAARIAELTERIEQIEQREAAEQDISPAQPICPRCFKSVIVTNVVRDFAKYPDPVAPGMFMKHEPLNSATVTLDCGHILDGPEGWNWLDPLLPIKLVTK